MAAPTSEAPIELTLTSLNGLDDFGERKILLTPGSTVPVGRSSKNAQKKLLPGPDNAYIDSPVISREHARISMNTLQGVPSIFIKDVGSMHGTLLNGKHLDYNKDHKLNSGDSVQFGVNVVRDQAETFIAKTFRVEAKPASSPAPAPPPVLRRGFSVPSASSSDEDDIDDTLVFPLSRAPRYGCQSNPVNVDDFEDPQTAVLAMPHDNMSLSPSPGAVLDEPPTSQLAHTEHENLSDDENSPVDMDDDDEEDLLSLLSAEVDSAVDIDSDDESEHSEDESDVVSSADSQDSHESIEDNFIGKTAAFTPVKDRAEEPATKKDSEAISRSKMNVMVEAANQKNDTPLARPSYSLAPPSQFAPLPSPAKDLPNAGHHTNIPTMNSAKQLPYSGEPVYPLLDPVEHWHGLAGPPLPPRPSAPKPIEWGFSGFANNSHAYSREPGNWWGEYSDAMFGPPADSDLTPESFMHVHAPPPLSTAPKFAPVRQHFFTPSVQQSKLSESPKINNFPAPPSAFTPNTPVENINDSPAPPVRRTKVSIPEIVENEPEQPPTPSSMKSLKRKAEVLDEMPEESIEELTEPTVDTTEAAVVSEPVEEPAAQPPRKKAKTVLSYAAAVATGAVFGGLSVMGALMALPTSVFE
ncbi:hypothetical protein EJ04DRAFT_581927 [Polyplosphaeria fusca]|uniref:FHA domain-containing protein n=1 Tax=Polyplosphaeria fusca TaxID=682080 RepID=A0A9P4QLE0_9PLEO|nr:hypothetical protein EJ04DRAFT_581927 [Polyplosphaeria fusca]